MQGIHLSVSTLNTLTASIWVYGSIYIYIQSVKHGRGEYIYNEYLYPMDPRLTILYVQSIEMLTRRLVSNLLRLWIVFYRNRANYFQISRCSICELTFNFTMFINFMKKKSPMSRTTVGVLLQLQFCVSACWFSSLIISLMATLQGEQELASFAFWE